MGFLTTKRFLPLFITQFFGAFNDNLLKNALVVLITYRLAMETGANAQILVTLAAGLFILPFLLFSATAGELADKYERSTLVRWVKIAEIAIMLLASVGFIMHNSWFLILVLFASGVHSTCFGPLKYVLIYQNLKRNELLSGNAYIEAATFLAILLGTICGGLFILRADGECIVSSMLVLFALCGYVCCRFIPLSPAPNPRLKLDYNLMRQTVRILGYSYKNKNVFICILCISWFWFVGATFLAQFPSYVKNYLHAEAEVVTLFLTIFSVGIGVGSFISSKLLRGVIKTTFVSMAALAMSVFIIDLYFASQSKIYFDLPALLSFEQFVHFTQSWRIMLDTLGIAIFAGIYIVPLYARMQVESDDSKRARIVAANNILNSLFMVASAVLTLGMLGVSCTIPEVFLVVGMVTAIVAMATHKSRLSA